MHAMVWPYMNIIMSRDSYVYFKDLTVEMGCLIGFLSSLPILDFIGALIAMCAFKRFEKAATLSQKLFVLIGTMSTAFVETRIIPTFIN